MRDVSKVLCGSVGFVRMTARDVGLQGGKFWCVDWSRFFCLSSARVAWSFRWLFWGGAEDLVCEWAHGQVIIEENT